MRRHPIALALILALALPALGCFTHTSLSSTRFALERENPGVRFDPEVQLKVGRLVLGLVRRFADEDDEDLEVLRHLDRVELAVYRTERLPRMPRRLPIKGDGWHTGLEVRDDDTATWVLFRADDEVMRRLLIATVDGDELVLVKLHGDLQEVFDTMLRDELLDIPGVVRADLDPPAGEKVVRIDPAL